MGTDVLLNEKWWEEKSRTKVSHILSPLKYPFSENQFYKPKTIAQKLDCSLDLIYKWINSGELVSQPLGANDYRILGAEIIRQLSRLRLRKR